MADPKEVHDDICKLKEDLHVLREKLAKMNETLAEAGRYRRISGNRRGRRASELPNAGRRESDRGSKP